MSRHIRTGRVCVAALLFLVIAVSLVAEVWIRHARAAQLNGPNGHALAAVLTRAGLDPAALAAAGVTETAAVNAAVDAAVAHLDQHPFDLANADVQYAYARRERDHLEALVRSGRASGEQLDALQAAQADLDAAAAYRQAALNDIHWAGVAPLDQAQRDALAAIRAKRYYCPTDELPIQYLFLDYAAGQWVNLREALDDLRISQRFDEDPHPNSVNTVLDADANTSVANANANLQNHLQNVTQDWNLRIGVE